MNQEFFTNLPSQIIFNILSRPPIRTIIHCKCVCKSWLDILESHEFAKSHLSKSVPGLAFSQQEMFSEFYKIYEFEYVLDLEQHELHYNLVTKFDFPYHDLVIQGSANGLLFLRDLGLMPNGLYICNPITRDYIEIHCPQEFVYSYPQVVTYGFGASKMTSQHKVVRIFHDCIRDQETHQLVSVPKSECQVYTLGTGSWRKIEPGAPLFYNCRSTGACLNGNLHWLVYDLKGSPLISCINLETELEYGVEKSWTKEYVISKKPDFVGEYYEVVYPIKVFKDGDILMAWQDFFLFYYSVNSNKTKTITAIDMFALRTPQALSTQSFTPQAFFHSKVSRRRMLNHSEFVHSRTSICNLISPFNSIHVSPHWIVSIFKYSRCLSSYNSFL